MKIHSCNINLNYFITSKSTKSITSYIGINAIKLAGNSCNYFFCETARIVRNGETKRFTHRNACDYNRTHHRASKINRKIARELKLIKQHNPGL